MAEHDCDSSVGYKCEFIDSVPEDFFCKTCSLVARRLAITSCCSETYCHSCITYTLEQGKPCPACGEKDCIVIQQMKYQKRVKELNVYCSVKEKGCDWSGTLEQLDTHLDPDRDNCQYLDTECPLNCQQTIPKIKVEYHVKNDCMQREYVCQHCNFKATYEEVVGTHFSECKYVPLQCPNLCGVTFERDFMEDHMKMCRLEEVKCDFSDVGCDDQCRREDQEEHTRQNSQKHLTLTASLAVETKEQLQQKLVEQDKKYQAEIEELKKELQKQHQEHKAELKKLKEKLLEQKQHLEKNFRMQLDETEQKFQKLLKIGQDQAEAKFSVLYSMVGLNRTLAMNNFSQEKAKNKMNDWMSPAMYTHMNGYKFRIGVDANGYGNGRGHAVCVSVWSSPGDYDSHLTWPARFEITLELLHQHAGDNLSSTLRTSWEKPKQPKKWVMAFPGLNYAGDYHFIQHSKVKYFLLDDTLHFNISKIEVL